MEINSYKELTVWKKSMDLVELIYKLTDEFPKNEVFGLSSQLKRATVSIPSNIAEGRRRGSRKEYCHFLFISYGSGAEVETQLEIAKRLGFGSADKIKTIEELLVEVMKMLNAMLWTMRESSPS
jgi:four helix bundle protein